LPITKLEAMLLELLASGVATGLARLEQERVALAAQVQLEQFFTVELARYLSANPQMLQGRNASVTVLFCDIRGFSRYSEKLGPGKTLEWINDVMGVLSDCVLAHKGVLVDYIGDELMAMWGAPEAQEDHAQRACRAALDMLAQLPRLNQNWEPILGGPMSVGIGINTGEARVGNTGCARKFKYGPLGNTVNLASRMQGATKYLKVRAIITGATHAGLERGFPTRRLGQVRVMNIGEPVQLFEVAPQQQSNWISLCEGFEEALQAFERRDFRQAARSAGDLLVKHPGDGPSLVLLSRAVNCLVTEQEVVDTVWELPGK
jgi:adenylate cyclase